MSFELESRRDPGEWRHGANGEFFENGFMERTVVLRLNSSALLLWHEAVLSLNECHWVLIESYLWTLKLEFHIISQYEIFLFFLPFKM